MEVHRTAGFAGLWGYLAVILLTVSAVGLRGDVVYLKDGGKVEGKARMEEGRVVVEVDEGKVELRREDVARIEKRPLPREEFAARLKQDTDARSSEACLVLARWAWEKHLEQEYAIALRAALVFDRKNAEARRRLQEFQLRLRNLPINEKASAKLLADLGGNFRLLQTNHFRVAYNCSEEFAGMTERRLEEVYQGFVEYFSSRGFELTPLADRLEVALFDSRQTFVQYAAAQEPSLAGSMGFFASKSNRSYFYDTLYDEQYQQYAEKLESAQDRLKEVRGEMRRNRSSRRQIVVREPDGTERVVKGGQVFRELQQQEKELNRQYEQLNTAYETLNVNITVHELVHQLAFNCGIHSRYYNTPLWLAEGLAMYFESAQGGTWEKPGQIHHRRLEEYARQTEEGGLLPLKRLAEEDGLFQMSGAEVNRAYTQAWALFYYLSNENHERLFDYIYDLSVRISNVPYGALERARDFQKYFGGYEQVETEWRGFMEGMMERELGGVETGK